MVASKAGCAKLPGTPISRVRLAPHTLIQLSSLIRAANSIRADPHLAPTPLTPKLLRGTVIDITTQKKAQAKLMGSQLRPGPGPLEKQVGDLSPPGGYKKTRSIGPPLWSRCPWKSS